MSTDSILSTQEIGEGAPILIIHGWEMSSKTEASDFEPIFLKTPGYRRIYVDLPGMGATPANGIKNLDDIFLRLAQFIDSRLGNSRFLLVGSSCGAYLARAIAQKYVDRIDGLLLRVPLMEPEDSSRDRDPFHPLVSNQHIISNLPPEDKQLLGDDILVQTPAYIATLKEKYQAAYVPAMQAADKAVLDPIRKDPQRYRLLVSLDDPKQDKLLSPTLIVCGRQDGSVGYRDSMKLLELYPRSTYVVLDRAAHDLPTGANQVGVFEALVRDWLARVSEWTLGKD